MGKSLPSSTRFQNLTRIIASEKFSRPTRPTQVRVSPPQTAKTGTSLRVDPERVGLKMESSEGQSRVPLARVVSDCAKRWFQDTLKEAKGGDTAMQVLVGQMFHSGYGVEKNPEKGHAWISRASRSRRAVWKVSQKQPGYHASDSDSDVLEDVAKALDMLSGCRTVLIRKTVLAAYRRAEQSLGYTVLVHLPVPKHNEIILSACLSDQYDT